MRVYTFGPKYSILIAGLGDLIGALIWPFGTYFVGFTISAALAGAVYGVLLYQKNKDISTSKFTICSIISNFVVLIIIKLLLESVWLNIMYGNAYIVIIGSRLVTQLVLFPIQIIISIVLYKALNPMAKKYLYEEREDIND